MSTNLVRKKTQQQIISEQLFPDLSTKQDFYEKVKSDGFIPFQSLTATLFTNAAIRKASDDFERMDSAYGVTTIYPKKKLIGTDAPRKLFFFKEESVKKELSTLKSNPEENQARIEYLEKLLHFPASWSSGECFYLDNELLN